MKEMYLLLVTYNVAFSIFAFLFTVFFVMFGGWEENLHYINKLTKRKGELNFLAFVAYSIWLSWFLMGLPILDLFTFHYLSIYQDDGLLILGKFSITEKEFEYLFVTFLFSIVGLKLSFRLTEIIPILRERPLRAEKRGLLIFVY